MSSRTLPPGTDVLEARRAEMEAHPHGYLGHDPGPHHATTRAIVLRTLAIESRLAALDGKPAPEPDPLRELAGKLEATNRHLTPGHHLAWPIMEALVVRFPAAEARLAALEGLPPKVEGPTLDMWQQMAAEMAVNEGRLPRDEGRYFEATRQLVGRVLDAEARLAAIEAAPRKASKS
jgi:hypothetical protein